MLPCTTSRFVSSVLIVSNKAPNSSVRGSVLEEKEEKRIGLQGVDTDPSLCRFLVPLTFCPVCFMIEWNIKVDTPRSPNQSTTKKLQIRTN